MVHISNKSRYLWTGWDHKVAQIPQHQSYYMQKTIVNPL